MSDTPRTDDIQDSLGGDCCQAAYTVVKFARELERELAEASHQFELLQGSYGVTCRLLEIADRELASRAPPEGFRQALERIKKLPMATASTHGDTARQAVNDARRWARDALSASPAPQTDALTSNALSPFVPETKGR